jgi:F0F1-type ATP synthase alpha subunit
LLDATGHGPEARSVNKKIGASKAQRHIEQTCNPLMKKAQTNDKKNKSSAVALGKAQTTRQKSMGFILNLKDGIAQVSGLPAVKSGELVRAEKNLGIVLNLQQRTISVVFFSDTNLKIGSPVTPLNKLINIPVSLRNLGKVLSVSGTNLNKPTQVLFSTANQRPVELKAPGIIVRQSIYEPLCTGTKIVDSIIPIGLGQRELIIGDRQTGKTTIALDAILING